MELREEERYEKKSDKKKIIKIALIASVALLILMIILLFAVPKPKKEVPLTLAINGALVTAPTNLCIFDSNTDNIYFSIKDLTGLLKYTYYKGEYLNRYTEDSTKCYVEAGQEITSFILGSNVIYKAKTNTTGRYDYYNIDSSIILNNSKLYSDMSGIKTGLNLYVDYNEQTKRITIYTLDYLFQKAKADMSAKYGYILNEKDFDNKKAILYDLFIGNTSSTNKLGVVNAKGETIIGTKYDSIVFSENTREFFVSSDKKAGIITLGGDTKIALNYEAIQLLEPNLRLYLVTKEKLKGVLDRNGKVLIHTEYTDIGINSSLFPKNRIKNSMLLYDNCIPVKKENKWGFFDKIGSLIIPIMYDKIGYTMSTSNEKIVNNALLLEDIDGIIVGITGEKNVTKYGVVNSLGELLIPCEYDRIYSITSGSEDIYYLEKAGTAITLDKYIADNNLKSYKNNTLEKIQPETKVTLNEEDSNTTTNTTSDIVL